MTKHKEMHSQLESKEEEKHPIQRREKKSHNLELINHIYNKYQIITQEKKARNNKSTEQRPESATSGCDLMSLIVVRLKVTRSIAAVVAELFVSMSHG
ncbi:hypothetical protein F2Q69_00036295 [Brassica cretica]|uniref:Uncharacterized protein n=1 Tax=Brassica cretica TaxID=69181 RepID=A0A8S9SHP3_BRACR|nr:hypothetical protein F2Q69_00036295 [Brassica cretica]